MAEHNEDEQEGLGSFFKDGVDHDDIDALYPIRRAQKKIQSLASLFRGGDAALVRIYILQEITSPQAKTEWRASDLRNYFGYIDPVKLETIIRSFANHGLLRWDSEKLVYSVAPFARLILSSITPLLSLEDEDSDLGFLFSSIAGSDAIFDSVTPHQLAHVHSRLIELKASLDDAITTGSEREALRAESRLKSIWKMLDKGSDYISKMSEKYESSPETFELAHKIGLQQSRLSNSTSSLHRFIHQIERQRLDLGTSGLSISDVRGWLLSKDLEEITRLADGCLTISYQHGFILSDIVLDIAEAEVLNIRIEPEDVPMPAPVEAVKGGINLDDEESLESLNEWLPALKEINQETMLEDLIMADSFYLSAYRLSLLAMLGRSGAAHKAMDEFSRLPLAYKISEKIKKVDDPNVYAISKGAIIPKGEQGGH